MTITNGYCTLAELKQFLLDQHTYTASTIAFNGTAKTITDTAYGLKRFQDGDNVGALLKVSGVTTNAGVYTTTACAAGSITVSESLTTMAAGVATTLSMYGIVEGQDSNLENAVNAASRWIDGYTQRQFYTAAETRYYTPVAIDEIYTDDLQSITTLKTDADGDGTYETTWATTDYNLKPYSGLPYTSIEIKSNGSKEFTCLRKAVQIAGTFGYCTPANLPVDIKQACLIQAARLFKRKDSVLGVAGTNQFGTLYRMPEADQDVKMLIERYRRRI